MIVGQEELRSALEIAYVADAVGGVLATGQRGTAKTTTVRAFTRMLTDELPVTLPIGATDDRVLGGWKIDKLMKGDPEPQDGLLLEASRSKAGILYIDEVNLLDDYLVNIILDVVSTGVLNVERDNLAAKAVPARFTLVGTMNPDEGSLRPQLLDRFGLVAEVRPENDADRRAEIMDAVLTFQDDPDSARVAEARRRDLETREALAAAKERVGQVRFAEGVLAGCARVAKEFGLAGHRGELVLACAARAARPSTACRRSPPRMSRRSPGPRWCTAGRATIPDGCRSGARSRPSGSWHGSRGREGGHARPGAHAAELPGGGTPAGRCAVPRPRPLPAGPAGAAAHRRPAGVPGDRGARPGFRGRGPVGPDAAGRGRAAPRAGAARRRRRRGGARPRPRAGRPGGGAVAEDALRRVVDLLPPGPSRRRDLALARIARAVGGFAGAAETGAAHVDEAAGLLGIAVAGGGPGAPPASEPPPHGTAPLAPRRPEPEPPAAGARVEATAPGAARRVVTRTGEPVTLPDAAAAGPWPYPEDDPGALSRIGTLRPPPGRRTRAGRLRGRPVGVRPASGPRDLAIVATVVEAAKFQAVRRAHRPDAPPGLLISPADLRRPRRAAEPGAALVLVLDHSCWRHWDRGPASPRSCARPTATTPPSP
ncbi:AAA family ATPase [Actinomadura sp. B10D3]|uniref:AAA family ATPase n=1 Tax=Actinomadura sp. B10D3 TaxID=3153557 RepID=UPI00325E4500